MKNDYIPLGGKSRNFKNIKTGEIISRRQYDKKFGSLAKTGFKTYEDKARAAKIIDERKQLLRPARGRKSFKIAGKTPSEIEHEIVERKIKNNIKHIPEPNIKNVKLARGKKSSTVRCDWSFEEIKKVISQINKMPESKMWAYLIGAHCIDDSGNTKDVSLLPSMHFQETFGEREWESMNDKLGKLHYGTGLTPVKAWVRMSFDADYAYKNAITIPTRKKRINEKKKPPVNLPKKKPAKR